MENHAHSPLSRVAGDGQGADAPRKRLLVIGEEKGYRHESVSHAMAVIERLGRDTGLWDTTIRTDTEALTRAKLEYNAKSLNDFDAVVFYTGGTLEMTPRQKADFLSFIHDDGKGFVGIHSATITFTDWPEYGEMIGGYFDEHPWGTFPAPILVEDPRFPGMSRWPASFTMTDEIYQMRNYSRDKLRVLMRLDASKLDLANSRVHRSDGDFAVTWAKMYGRGRVFYTTLGHPVETWDRPEMQGMLIEAVKWRCALRKPMSRRDRSVSYRDLPVQKASSMATTSLDTQLSFGSRRSSRCWRSTSISEATPLNDWPPRSQAGWRSILSSSVRSVVSGAKNRNVPEEAPEITW